MVINVGYLGEYTCYKSCPVLDERALFEFAAENPSRCDDILVLRTRDLLRKRRQRVWLNSALIAAAQPFGVPRESAGLRSIALVQMLVLIL